MWRGRSTWNNSSVDGEAAGAVRQQLDGLEMIEMCEFDGMFRRGEHEEAPFEPQKTGYRFGQLSIGPDCANRDDLGLDSLRWQSLKSRVFYKDLFELQHSHNLAKERGLSRLGLDHRQSPRRPDNSQRYRGRSAAGSEVKPVGPTVWEIAGSGKRFHEQAIERGLARWVQNEGRQINPGVPLRQDLEVSLEEIACGIGNLHAEPVQPPLQPIPKAALLNQAGRGRVT
jgi:hypothetical protein